MLLGFSLDRSRCRENWDGREYREERLCLFAASYAPADNPELVVVVVIEEGGFGSQTAAPVARKIYEAYFGWINRPRPDNKSYGPMEAAVLSGKTGPVAEG